MKAKGIRCEVGLVILLTCALAAVAAHAQENCTPVHFERGKSSAIIHGTAPPEDVICYTFDAGAGQTANLKVSGSNMIISVVGIGDARVMDLQNKGPDLQVYRRPAHAVSQ
jgi:hypothetical protein